ncbi:hypothetical protein V6N11_071880 [Hibiscus sabdariffa]|uniref:Reverse transcriptase domain-containing protein n=1 Tax=Hibiscus sabdariffa TaxID=183260 RepID=A0ABR2U1N6_9ROSI
MASRKSRIGEFETTAATETCLAMMHNNVPAKKTDPGSFIIPCSIGHNYSTKALCDPGVSINLMPKSVFQKLGIGEAKPTTVMLQLRDHSTMKHPVDSEDCQMIEATTEFNPDTEITYLSRKHPINLGDLNKDPDDPQNQTNPETGYNKIDIAPEDQSKTTFTGPYGTFAFRRMPFGLCNTPATFQRCMTTIFSDMNEDCLEIFMDDISIFGDDFTSCLSNLEQVLTRCKETNLMLNWEKCHFMVDEGIVLGHKISYRRLEVDRAKIDVIRKLPPPTTVNGICSFLGHA